MSRFRRGWRSTPPQLGRIAINWDNPITRRLQFAHPFASVTLDNFGPVGGAAVVKVGTLTWMRSPQNGLWGVGAPDGSTDVSMTIDNAVVFPSSYLESTFIGGAWFMGNSGWSTMPWGDRHGQAPYYTLNWDDPTNDSWGFLSGASMAGYDNASLTGMPELDQIDSLPNQMIIADAGDQGEIQLMLVSRSTRQLYLGINNPGNRGNDTGFGNAFVLGEGRSGRFVRASWQFFYIWDRKLANPELESIGMNPWQIWQ